MGRPLPPVVDPVATPGVLFRQDPAHPDKRDGDGPVNAGSSPSSAAVVPLAEILRIDPDGDGVHWTLEAPGDLNVNLVHLDAGSRVETHVNSDLDVVLIVLVGNGRLSVDGTDHVLAPHVLAFVGKGIERSISAGSHGLSYLTVHRRRSALGITASEG